MSEEAAVAPAAVKAKAAKPRAPRKAASHPPFNEMIAAAIVALADRKGSSKIAIQKYILAHYNVEDNKMSNTNLNRALKRGVTAGKLVTAKGHAGSFKAAKAEKPKKAAAAKTPVKKPAVKVYITCP